MHCRQYSVMENLADTLAALAADPSEVKVVAGGTDLLVRSAKILCGELDGHLLDISQLEELRGIAVEGSYLSVGAAVTLTELVQSPLVREHAPALAQGAASAASWQIRNQATIGGNLVNASPAADTIPPLAAAGAVIEVTSTAGARKILVVDLVLGPGQTCLRSGEMLKRILVPLRAEREGQSFAKLGRRQALSVSIVNAAACVQRVGEVVTSACVALGAVAPKVLVSQKVKDLLVGYVPDSALWACVETALRDEVKPIDDLRAGADYRRAMAGAFGRRVLETAYALAYSHPDVGERWLP